MPAKGIEQVRGNLKKIFADIENNKAKKAAFVAVTVGGGIADVHTPMDTGNLLNSRFKVIEKSTKGWTARYGYTANYAAAVHSFTGKLKGQPRATFGKTGNQSQFGPQMPKDFGGGTGQGNYWGPQGEPHWLNYAFDDHREKIDAAVFEAMKL
jgi:hypothetical protein